MFLDVISVVRNYDEVIVFKRTIFHHIKSYSMTIGKVILCFFVQFYIKTTLQRFIENYCFWTTSYKNYKSSYSTTLKIIISPLYDIFQSCKIISDGWSGHNIVRFLFFSFVFRNDIIKYFIKQFRFQSP